MAAGTQTLILSIAAGRVMSVVIGGRLGAAEPSPARQAAVRIKNTRLKKMDFIIPGLSMGGERSVFSCVSHARAIDRYR